MLVLEGKAFLSPAQITAALAEVNEKLQTTVEQLAVNSVHYIHLKDGVKDLTDEQRVTVNNCLDFGYKRIDIEKKCSVIVLPRPGTITPWSSKATEILGLCIENFPIERIEHGTEWTFNRQLTDDELTAVKPVIHDRMTQVVLPPTKQATEDMLFHVGTPAELRSVDRAVESLNKANSEFGLALKEDEIEYIVDSWTRPPTNVELMMFAQVNSEHCRHKIFNAEWVIDDKVQDHSLFAMIRNTHKENPKGVLSAYKDNAAVLQGPTAQRFFANHTTREYGTSEEPIHIVIKVETHNHPTAVSPFSGAATGSGGEIRDEGATGIGGKPKAGLCGFSVSHLLIPDCIREWEEDVGKPSRISSAMDIMLDAPIGSARFNNEFGRPNICGYFRSFLQKVNGEIKGYHKPIMLAGGLGNIRDKDIEKRSVPPGAHVVVLGGPSMLIGLGGGAASSMAQGQASETIDFASVQRDNAELERRCQEVIDACWAAGESNPILLIHDVGAGGLSNAIPEVLHDSGLGGLIDIRKVPSTELGMSPMEIWCNEAQERYVIACDEEGFKTLESFCKRERCPYASVGKTTSELRLIVHDPHFNNNPVDLSMETLYVIYFIVLLINIIVSRTNKQTNKYKQIRKTTKND